MEEVIEQESIPCGGPGAVMVVGGGVSGIQASLDLASSGFKVYLVDEAAAIGGKMAQLDKTFPTNDCSMCILSPKLIECYRNPNIEIITNTRVVSVKGGPGDFSLTLLKRPRYVDEEKCVGCGTCARYCPVKNNDPFNENISSTKCIHIPYPQAVPALSIVDPQSCWFLIRRECKICVPVCKNKAINLYQQEEELEINVGAIILSPGYEKFDPRLKGEYGYGSIPNIITSLEFERISTASGPYQGEIIRPWDRKSPRKIAWIQCVGSRDVNTNSYCSSVCCMYAIKQVTVVKEHDNELEAAIFYIDIRAFGKGFERYYESAINMPGVRFIRSQVSVVRELSQEGNVVLRYCGDEEKVQEEAFDLVVLCIGLMQSHQTIELAQRLGIELNSHSFCHAPALSPGMTSRPGIYASGAFCAPLDIPESVAAGSSAAALCSQVLSVHRGSLTTMVEYPPERDVCAEELKIGVFVCHCGTNIARTVGVPNVVEYSKTLDGVVHAEENLFSCSADSVRHITEIINEKGLNRVVVAACTPRTHEPVFQETLKEAGLSPNLFEMANIREHCSWVHSREKDRAQQKAKELVKMAVAKTRLLQPLQQIAQPVVPMALIIGGGISGMTSALSLARQGFEVHLVERSERLGGVGNRIHYTLEGDDVQSYLSDLIQQVQRESLIHLYTETEIITVSGSVGDFITEIRLPNRTTMEIRHGAVIIATGADEYKPREYLYQQDSRVLTLLELEEAIAKQDPRLSECQSLVMIQCVGSRDEERPYCSRVCCSHSVKCALKLKELNPAVNIFILYRDIRTYGFKEDYYREAANQEIRFIRYDPDSKPEVEIIDDNLRVTLVEPVLNKRFSIDTDILALAAGTVASSGNLELSQLFKIPRNTDGFFLEAHLKLRPMDFANEGVFLCGLAHSPKLIDESISQANAAASRAATVLSRKFIMAGGVVADVDWEQCIGCGICQSVCPFGAIELKDVEDLVRALVLPALCKGCGMCSARCPTRAIDIGGFSDEQILSQIEALVLS